MRDLGFFRVVVFRPCEKKVALELVPQFSASDRYNKRSLEEIAFSEPEPRANQLTASAVDFSQKRDGGGMG